MNIFKKGSLMLIFITSIFLFGCEIVETTKNSTLSTTSNTSTTRISTTTAETIIISDCFPVDQVLVETDQNMENVRSFENNVIIDISYEDVLQKNIINYQYDLNYDAESIIKITDDNNEAIFIETNEDKFNYYSGYYGIWHKKVVNSDYPNVPLKYFRLDELFAETHGLIHSDNQVNTYKLTLYNSELFFMGLTVEKEELLEELKISLEEFEDIFIDNTYIVRVDKNRNLVLSIEADFTNDYNELMALAASKGVELDVEAIDSYKITIEFDKYNEVDLTITDEMRNGIIMENIKDLEVYEALINMITNVNNFEASINVDASNSVMDFSYNNIYSFDLDENNKGIINVIENDFISYLEIDEFIKNYYYLNNTWGTEDADYEFLYSKYQFSNKRNYDLFNLVYSNDYSLISSENGINTYEFKVNSSDLFFAGLDSNHSFINEYNISISEFNELLADCIYYVTIDTNQNIVTKIEVDYSQTIIDLFVLVKEKTGQSIEYFTNYKMVIVFGKFNEVDLAITDEMRGLQ